jgi:predicted pyridoxine 5'-phosphate oxidase superfamily flavin-nucleotide-binding protein
MAGRSEQAVGKRYATIDDTVRKFIEAQPMFFVGSAPLSADGHVNISPKGLDTLRVLGPRTIAYLDLTGSGIETVSHLKENGRVVLVFCAFQGPPKIFRLHGRGTVIEPGDDRFAELAAHFQEFEGTRSIIYVDVSRIADSCGYSVPLLRYEGERSQLTAWAHKLGPEALKTYRHEKNRESIDQIPGLK